MERSTIQLLAKRGKSHRQIAREMGISRITVARALREPIDRQPSKRKRSSIADGWDERIRQWLSEGLTTVRMLELARCDAEQPYLGGHSVFGDHVRRLRREREQSLADVPIRFEGLPGEYLQVDWGEVRHFPFTGQAAATRYFLSCRLKYSRWSWLCWTASMEQETLLRGLVDCFLALGWVPWVLVFDNMKTVTSGRDAQDQAIWNPVLLQFAKEFDFHPQACWPGAANQKGSTESLVKWVKGNFLSGRSFADDADLASQSGQWLEMANARLNAATGQAPLERLGQEADKGGRLPASAWDYALPHSCQVSSESLVHVEGNAYSVPLGHIGAPVTVRLHRQRLVIWRDGERLAEHQRAPRGAQRRVRMPEHFRPLFTRKRRAQMMLEREALLALGGCAGPYLSELCRRRRERLVEEIGAIYCLYQEHGQEALLSAMQLAEQAGIYGADYLAQILVSADVAPAVTLALPDLPTQAEVDRYLSSYETWVTVESGLADSLLAAEVMA